MKLMFSFLSRLRGPKIPCAVFSSVRKTADRASFFLKWLTISSKYRGLFIKLTTFNSLSGLLKLKTTTAGRSSYRVEFLLIRFAHFSDSSNSGET